jgi:hypothetical protein
MKYPSFKSWYYKYVPGAAVGKDSKTPIWILYDDEEGNVFTFNANIYRIDQCFNYVFRHLASVEKYSKTLDYLIQLEEKQDKQVLATINRVIGRKVIGQ